jgi:Protein of unknown function (DUF3738).
LAIGLLAILSAQTPISQFDVVSIKPSSPSAKPVQPPTISGDRLIMRNQPIRRLVWFAYEPIEGGEIVGGPAWMHRDVNFDIEAKGTAPINIPQAKAMARQLLADRFQLRAHYEKQERPVLALMLLKPDSGLPKGLVRSSFDCEPLIARMRTELLDPTSFQIPKGSNGAPVCMTTAGNTVASGAATMDELATRLTRPGQPKVVNKTSLEGRYEFRLQYSPSIPANATGDEPPPLATALQQQLGLRLVSEKDAARDARDRRDPAPGRELSSTSLAKPPHVEH